LILRKIIKIVAANCHILKLKCTKFNFGWGSAADPAGRAYKGRLRKDGMAREGEKGGVETYF